MVTDQLRPGVRVRIEQRIRRRQGEWKSAVEGEIVEIGAAPTGSWHAAGQEGKQWLGRIKLKKADGELSTLTLDEGSQVVLLPTAGDQ